MKTIRLALLYRTFMAGCSVTVLLDHRLSAGEGARAAEVQQSLEQMRAEQISFADSIEQELGQAREVELISLDSQFYESKEAKEADTRPKLDLFPIIETKPLRDPTAIRSLGEALAKGLREREIDGNLPGCFNPQHAVRWYKDGKPMLLIVCFHCGNGGGEGFGSFKGFLITQSPKKVFEQVFFEAGMTKAGQLQAERDERLQKELEERKRRYNSEKRTEVNEQPVPTRGVPLKGR